MKLNLKSLALCAAMVSFGFAGDGDYFYKPFSNYATNNGDNKRTIPANYEGKFRCNIQVNNIIDTVNVSSHYLDLEFMLENNLFECGNYIINFSNNRNLVSSNSSEDLLTTLECVMHWFNNEHNGRFVYFFMNPNFQISFVITNKEYPDKQVCVSTWRDDGSDILNITCRDNEINIYELSYEDRYNYRDTHDLDKELEKVGIKTNDIAELVRSVKSQLLTYLITSNLRGRYVELLKKFYELTDVFGGNLGGSIFKSPAHDSNQYFGSEYNTDELKRKAEQYTFPVDFGIKITHISKDGYEAKVDLCGIYQGYIHLSENNPIMSINIKTFNSDEIHHILKIVACCNNKYRVFVKNIRELPESEQTLYNAFSRIGLNLPLLCKALIKLQDMKQDFIREARKVGSTFTL